ncbi:dihydroxyacetone kinase subunit DhaL [Rhizobium sp. RAF56]|uniref:dihydroxyacetone kinase subunit DhaL n=1 Tax=Rhizobium sp. RAF56 TaxID=3233062 RepID=UPI003F96088D
MAITTNDLQRLFAIIAEEMTKNRDYLCELDGAIGDGDHGIAMDTGCQAAAASVAALDASLAEPTTVFNTAAKAFLNAVGASSGPLYATAFMRAGAVAKGRRELSDDDFVDIFKAMAQGIEARGKAELGEKTMLDAWKPAADAAEAARRNGASLASTMAAAAAAARLGCEATSNMIAAKGRASRLGYRALGHLDPGAVSTTLMIDAIERFCRHR